MRTVRGMLGMPVVCDGRKIGRMIQADIAEDFRQLDGIWLNAGLRGARYIPSDRLEMIGKACIISDDRGGKKPMRAQPVFRRAVSTDGQRLGAITGAEIDEITFSVTALELSAGLWDDLLWRRQRVTRFAVNRETGEVVIDLNGQDKEAQAHEGQHDEGADNGHADRRIGGHGLRRDELAEGEGMEPTGQENRQLVIRAGGKPREEVLMALGIDGIDPLPVFSAGGGARADSCRS